MDDGDTDCTTILRPLLHTYFLMIPWQRRGHCPIAAATGATKASTGKTGVHLQITTPAVSIENSPWSRRRTFQNGMLQILTRRKNAIKQIRKRTPARSNSLQLLPKKCRRHWPPQLMHNLVPVMTATP